MAIYSPVFLPGESHGQRNLASYSTWVCKESDTTEGLTHTHTHTHTHTKCANMGSAKPCLHPILPDFPTGKATTLEDLNVISTQLFIFLKLVLLGERRWEDGQVLLDGYFTTFSGNL